MILTLDGEPVTGADDLIRLLTGDKIGRAVEIDVAAARQARVTITSGARSERLPDEKAGVTPRGGARARRATRRPNSAEDRAAVDHARREARAAATHDLVRRRGRPAVTASTGHCATNSADRERDAGMRELADGRA